MGVNGDVTMTNLKAATGIADDRLSAHHPNGTGNATAMSDFLVDGVGSRIDVDGDTVQEFVKQLKEENIPSEATVQNCPDGTGGNAELCVGNKFEVSLLAEFSPSFGQFVADQIILNGNGISVSTQNCQLLSKTKGQAPTSSSDKIILEFEVTGGDFVRVDLTYDDGGLNSDATHYGAVIEYDNDSVQTSQVILDVFSQTTDIDSSISPDFSLNDPEDKAGGFFVDWGDGTTDTWTDSQPFHSYDSTGGFTMTVEAYDPPGQNDRPNNSPLDTGSATITVESGGGTK